MMLANQMDQMHMDANPVQTIETIVIEKVSKPKIKKYTITLDPTTELSDEQMKASFTCYHEPRLLINLNLG